jgi:predicted Fe-Mo cluster-binding NifX family protein
MTRKVAISVFGSRISSRLDCSECILLVSIETGKVVRQQQTRWPHLNPLEKIRLLIQEGTEVLICGGLTEAWANMLHESGIEVFPWVQGEVEDVLVQFMQGTLRPARSGKGNGTSP